MLAQPPALPIPTVVFVDDDPHVLAAIQRTFQEARVHAVLHSDPRRALDYIAGHHPEVVVSDQRMPTMRGTDLLVKASRVSPGSTRILLTGYADLETALDAVNLGGVSRILTKPWEVEDLRDTILGAAQAVALERFARASLVEQGVLQTVQALAAAIEAKDPYTRGHSDLVGRYGAAMARRLGMTPAEIESVQIGGILHDCGKIGVPEDVLLKPGRLDDRELAEMKRHPEVGMSIIAPIDGLPEDAVDAVGHHHERWAGGGYPHGLVGEEIAPVVRVVTVADAFEAMTSSRVYRTARPLDWVRAEIERFSGVQFDPQVAKVALELLDAGEFGRIRGDVDLQPQAPSRACLPQTEEHKSAHSAGHGHGGHACNHGGTKYETAGVIHDVA